MHVHAYLCGFAITIATIDFDILWCLSDNIKFGNSVTLLGTMQLCLTTYVLCSWTLAL